MNANTKTRTLYSKYVQSFLLVDLERGVNTVRVTDVFTVNVKMNSKGGLESVNMEQHAPDLSGITAAATYVNEPTDLGSIPEMQDIQAMRNYAAQCVSNDKNRGSWIYPEFSQTAGGSEPPPGFEERLECVKAMIREIEFAVGGTYDDGLKMISDMSAIRIGKEHVRIPFTDTPIDLYLKDEDVTHPPKVDGRYDFEAFL